MYRRPQLGRRDTVAEVYRRFACPRVVSTHLIITDLFPLNGADMSLLCISYGGSALIVIQQEVDRMLTELTLWPSFTKDIVSPITSKECIQLVLIPEVGLELLKEDIKGTVAEEEAEHIARRIFDQGQE